MNKTAIIIGSVALLGVGAYFYFKPKSTGTAGSETAGADTLGAGLMGAGTTGTGTTGTGTTGTGTTGTGTTGTGATGAGTTSVPPTGTVLTTPQQVEDTAKKIAEAKSLATQISDLRAKRNSYVTMSLSEFKKVFSNQTFWNDTSAQIFKDNQISNLLKSIKNLDEQLGKLGYMEVNGSITKIV
jgi:hypothetical protein